MNFWERVKFLFKPQREYLIIEVPATRTHIRWDEETKASVRTLDHHPGFLAVVDKVNLQKAMLVAQLTNTFHKDLRQVDYLQAGVFWLGLLERLVQSATNIGSKQYISPEDEDMQAFREIDSQIRRLE